MTISIRKTAAGTTTIDLGRRVATTLGGDFALYHAETRMYLGPSGWQEERYLFKPEVSRDAASTLLTAALPDADGLPGALVILEMPNSSYREEFVWTAAQPPQDDAGPTPADDEWKEPIITVLEKALEAPPTPVQAAVEPQRKVVSESAVGTVMREFPGASPSRRVIKRTRIAAAVSVLLIASTAGALWWWSRELANEQAALAEAKENLRQEKSALDAAQEQLAKEKETWTAVAQRAERDVQNLRIERIGLDGQRARLQRDREALVKEAATLKEAQEQLGRDRDELQRMQAAVPQSLAPQPPSPAPAQASPTLQWGTVSAAAANPTQSQRSSWVDTSDIQECDRLAGNPYDTNRSGDFPGVSFKDLAYNAARAVQVCERAVSQTPSVPRVRYQLARALQAGNDNARAIENFISLAQAGYPAAFDNLANLYMKTDRLAEAVIVLRDGVAAGDPSSMVSLAYLIEQGKAVATSPTEAWDLLVRAGDLGHAGAKEGVARYRTSGVGGTAVPRVFDILNQVLRNAR